MRQGKAFGDEYGNKREEQEKGRKQEKEKKEDKKVKKGRERSGGWWVMEWWGQGQEMA